jgi:hypothetical protein
VAVGSSNTASLGVPAGRAAGTYAYVRMASNDDCVLPSNTYTVEVLDAPAAPTNASSSARCGAGTVTFSATVPAGLTIDWYTADTGGTLVSGAGSVTSFSPSINASATYYADARHIVTGCVSSSRLAVGAYVGNPATGEQPVDPLCGCAAGLSDCKGLCLACCGTLPCTGFTVISCTPLYAIAPQGDIETVCKTLGPGWRVPTLEEMRCICANKSLIENLNPTNHYYYTTELVSPQYYVSVALNNCNETSQALSYYGFWRCVR